MKRQFSPSEAWARVQKHKSEYPPEFTPEQLDWAINGDSWDPVPGMVASPPAEAPKKLATKVSVDDIAKNALNKLPAQSTAPAPSVPTQGGLPFPPPIEGFSEYPGELAWQQSPGDILPGDPSWKDYPGDALPVAPPVELEKSPSTTSALEERGVTLSPEQVSPEKSELERFLAMQDALSNSPEFARGRAGAEDMDQMLAMQEALPQQVDLTPLIGMVDTLFGGDQAKNYKRPTSAEDRLKSLIAQKNALQDDKLARSSKLAEAAKGIMASEDSKSFNAKLLKLKEMQLTHQKKESAAQNRLKHKDLGESVVKTGTALSKIGREFDQIESTLNPPDGSKPDYQGLTVTLSTIAKVIGREAGMLSNDDIDRVLPPNFNGVIHRLQAFFNDNGPNAELDPRYVKQLRILANESRRNISREFKNIINLGKNRYQNDPNFEEVDIGKQFSVLDEMLGGLQSRVEETDKSLEKLKKKKPAAPEPVEPAAFTKDPTTWTDEERASVNAYQQELMKGN